MLWWSWSGKQKLTLLAAMLCIAAVPWILVGWLQSNLGAFAGGTAFLTIPQIVAWFLFVGLKTGRLPVRGGEESRTESPMWFWIAAAGYLAVLATFLWFVVVVLTT